MSSASLKTVGAYALVLVGVATLVVLSALSIHPSRAGATARTLTAANAPSGSPAGVAACSVLPGSSTSVATLRRAQTEARVLLDKGNTGEALAHLRSLEAADPGLPGIYLDLSTALLKEHQTEGAKSAVNAQLSASECLSHLPANALDAYCNAQMKEATAAGCRVQLAAIERSAHFQSALVQMELADAMGGSAPTPSAASLNPSLRPSPSSHPNPSSTPSASLEPRPHLPPSKPSPKLLASAHPQGTPAKAKVAGGNPLAVGAGTDAALGAYSK